MVRPSLRKEMAKWAVRYRSVSIALACRTFSISETCYRYQPKLNDENELIADWLVALTNAKKTWGFGLCFLHLRNVKGFRWNHKRTLQSRVNGPERTLSEQDVSAGRHCESGTLGRYDWPPWVRGQAERRQP